MPALNQSLREKLIASKQSMSKGPIIDNKSFTRGVFRLLRNFDQNEEPGYKNVSYYNEGLKIGSTSPISFGLKCPIDDYLTELGVTGSKEDRDLAWKAVKPSTEYWMAVLDMEDPGTVEKPNIRIFRAKRTLYDQILAQMLDMDAGSDICDPEEGRDAVIKKEGQKLDTKWTVVWKSDAPVSDDPDFIEAVRNVANQLVVPNKFFAVDWDNLAKLYENLTGNEMPEHYREQEGAEAQEAPAKKPAAKAPAKPAPKAPVKPAAKAKPAPEPEADTAADDTPADDGAGGELHPDPETLGITIGTTRVSFVGENGAATEGKIVAHDADTGDYDVEDDTGEIWTMGISDLTVLPEVSDAPKSGPKKKGAKPAAPAKPAPAAAKPAAKVPAKPASAGIRARLTK